MTFLYVLLVCISLSDSNAWLLSGPDCDDQKDCVSCTSTKSWSGQNCRWCPRRSTCHTFGSLENKCSQAENIIESNDCSKIVYRRYDNNLAYKMIFLCSIAYSNNVARYLPRATEVNTFHLVKQVTKPCSGGAFCSGFVAVSHSEKSIAVAFRGTEHSQQLVNEILRILTEPKQVFETGGRVQRYFLHAFEVVWSDLQNHVYEQLRKHPSYKVLVTGHSLGGAIASIASTVIAFKKKTTKDNLLLYTFGQPRVGNHEYALSHDTLVPLSYRVTHYRDIVVNLPTCKTVPPAPCISVGGGPYHHGKEIYYPNEIMTRYSPYKTCIGLPYNEDLSCSNNPKVWLKCFSSQFSKCIDDHQQYFGISVGTWWENL